MSLKPPPLAGCAEPFLGGIRRAGGAPVCIDESSSIEVVVSEGSVFLPCSASWRRLALAAMRKSPCVDSPPVSLAADVGARSAAVTCASRSFAFASDLRWPRMFRIGKPRKVDFLTSAGPSPPGGGVEALPRPKSDLRRRKMNDGQKEEICVSKVGRHPPPSLSA